jgi:hypothetical protein
MRTRQTDSLSENVSWGIRRGLSMASLFSAYVVVVAVMQRSVQFDAYGANVFQLVLIYLLGGLLGGAVVGALRPLNATGAGGAPIGALASIPFWAGTLMLLVGMPTRWDRGDWVVLMILVGLGALLGMHFATRK